MKSGDKKAAVRKQYIGEDKGHNVIWRKSDIVE